MRDESAVLLTLLLFFLLGIQAIRSRGRFEGPTEASNNQKVTQIATTDAERLSEMPAQATQTQGSASEDATVRP
jgi:hypothetical protein